MGERQVAQTARGELLQLLQGSFDVVPAFCRMDHRQASRSEHRAHLPASGGGELARLPGAEVFDELNRPDGRGEGTGKRRNGQCCVTRTVVFICMPVSRSLALIVKIPAMLTSNVISRRVLPAGPGLRPLKRKSPKSSLCETCSASPW